ncbi:PEGA domain-containing protein [Salmonirosea aquatica]|uniref:PEGA domain-containing protein n=1 Tax=Salmonirosea aquatica TaxID=2654236 RepID=A0A7C9F7B6_9BACT|nr:PEGA domain-containing protein [Cytophagaceae bacterium SJW1-29]
MKTIKKITVRKTVAMGLAGSILFSSCSSVTTIQSNPSGAKVYLNEEPVGTTPYTHRDSKIVGSTTSVRLEKEGYAPLITSFSRNEEADVGAIIGGVFLLVPFLWTMKYKPLHTYELPTGGTQANQYVPGAQSLTPVKTKTDQLRELKQLLDEKVITQEEFEAEKKKILEGNK